MSEERPPNLPPRRKLDIERPIGMGRAGRNVPLLIYGFLVLALLGVALYMAAFERHALTSGFVAGPIIGVLWFALRLFMIWGSKD